MVRGRITSPSESAGGREVMCKLCSLSVDWKGTKSMSCSSVSLSIQSLLAALPPASADGFEDANILFLSPFPPARFRKSSPQPVNLIRDIGIPTRRRKSSPTHPSTPTRRNSPPHHRPPPSPPPAPTASTAASNAFGSAPFILLISLPCLKTRKVGIAVMS